jgi:hypothetical protein
LIDLGLEELAKIEDPFDGANVVAEQLPGEVVRESATR